MMGSSAVENIGSVSSISASLSRRPALSPTSATTTPKNIKRSSKKSSVKTKAAERLTVQEQVLQLLAIAVVAGLVASSGFKSVEWAKQQLKPFCDSSDEASDAAANNCMPCPSNGYCQGGRLECLAGFKREGKKCAPDKEIDRTARKLATAIKKHVCGAAARSLCDGATGSVWLSEADVLENLKREGLEEQLGLDETFYLVWEKTAALARDDTIVIQDDLQGKREFHCPRDLAQGYKSVGCLIKELLWENVIFLFFLSPVIVFVGSFVINYLRRRKLNTRAEELYLEVCEALEEKALEAKETDGESWAVVSRMRDHLLSPIERKDVALWKQVERMVQEDSRIDQYQKKVKGEMKIVWEWQVEGAIRTPGSRKKQRTNLTTELPVTPLQVSGNGTSTSRFVEETSSPLQL
ncbi:hypothetical protein Mapa_015192 [Marchantia paleacea]|nr:hypothetical protein Mapa_015192 [Marchantia paleacea]